MVPMTVKSLQKKDYQFYSPGRLLSHWIFNKDPVGLAWTVYSTSPSKASSGCCIFSIRIGDGCMSEVVSLVVSLASKFYFLYHRSILVFSHIWFGRIFFQVFLTNPQTQYFIKKKKKNSIWAAAPHLASCSNHRIT